MSSPNPVEIHGDWLRVPLRDGHADFHARWLRHHCDQDRHPLTRERTLCSSELPDDLRAVAAHVDDETLVVRFSQADRVSRFPLRWLEEHAYARGRIAPPRPPSDVAAITVEGGAASVDERVAAALRRLDEQAVVVVRRSGGPPPEEETEALVDAFAARGLSVIGTHFGRIEDLRTDNTTNQNTDQLGYTDAAVDVHTDQPFIARPPRLQLLQAIRAADEGGESVVVDALAAARLLAAEDAEAHRLLTTVPVAFHRKQMAFESRVEAPILRLEPTFQVRYSYFTIAPFALPFAELPAFYRAWDRFARLVRDPKNQLRFTLRPGDFLLYDNHRVLHGRTAFRGPRWVRGVYFDRA
jgi:gamma-butyrobetaine dioxygenase/trimethyllysine dioxygenase